MTALPSEPLGRPLDDLVAIRRHLHAHPELGRAETATTEFVTARLREAGLTVSRLPIGTGAWCDIGPDGGATVLLRADIDALPLEDAKEVDYRSTVPGVCHACGHDVHTAVLLGAAMRLADLAAQGQLPGRVRLVFQPAEELMPGGALDVLAAGLCEDVDWAFALHCDPSLEVGHVGLLAGPITAAADRLEVRLAGPGGHTSRPHNTVDLVYALGRIVTDLPALLTRTLDPRAAVTLVWGQVSAGTVANAIPRTGLARGTLRMLDHTAWRELPDMVTRLCEAIAAPFGAEIEVDYRRGVPPVVNDATAVELLRAGAEDALGPGSVVPTVQSLGGEDFGWYLERVPGAMARLGTRSPDGPRHDLHQSSFDVDERCLSVGARLLAGVALATLRSA